MRVRWPWINFDSVCYFHEWRGHSFCSAPLALCLQFGAIVLTDLEGCSTSCTMMCLCSICMELVQNQFQFNISFLKTAPSQQSCWYLSSTRSLLCAQSSKSLLWAPKNESKSISNLDVLHTGFHTEISYGNYKSYFLEKFLKWNKNKTLICSFSWTIM